MTWLRYVAHAEVEAFKALGWVLSDDLSGTPHGNYSVIMEWPHESEPPQ